MKSALAALLDDPELAADLADNGLRAVRERHTCAHRVDELSRIVDRFPSDPDRREPPAAQARGSRYHENSFFGSSLVSSYWNGAATYYRGILKALAKLGYEISFFEPDAFQRQQHRDIADPELDEGGRISGDDGWLAIVASPRRPERPIS